MPGSIGGIWATTWVRAAVFGRLREAMSMLAGGAKHAAHARELPVRREAQAGRLHVSQQHLPDRRHAGGEGRSQTLVPRQLQVETGQGWDVLTAGRPHLDARQVHAILSVLLWPVVWLLPFDGFSVQEIARLQLIRIFGTVNDPGPAAGYLTSEAYATGEFLSFFLQVIGL